MSGFEGVVRPVVFPNIRPQAPRVLPPASDPTQGIATIGGSGGRVIDLPHSWSASSSHSGTQKETERTYDVDRIYQKDDDGNINKDNFVDTERVTQMRMREELQTWKLIFERDRASQQADNVETLKTNIVRKNTFESAEGS